MLTKANIFYIQILFSYLCAVKERYHCRKRHIEENTLRSADNAIKTVKKYYEANGERLPKHSCQYRRRHE